MEKFRFAIMGAGGIAVTFCDAVKRLEGCEVAAVASKSLDRAKKFAEKNGVKSAYGSYEEMLAAEKPDCVYIAVLPNDHYRLTMLCLEQGVPVLCEKAMFMSGREAESAFAKAKEKNVFVMEAMWARFLPPMQKAKRWLEEGRIGKVVLCDTTIGFLAQKGSENRYHNPALGAGAAHDITVYCYELTRYLFPQPIISRHAVAWWEDTGTDLTDHIILRYADMTATMTASLGAALDERMIIYGEEGRIVIPHPHYSNEAFLYDVQGGLLEHFQDDTPNGFIFEIQETMDCIRSGKTQSRMVPWADTLECSHMYDELAQRDGRSF